MIGSHPYLRADKGSRAYSKLQFSRKLSTRSTFMVQISVPSVSTAVSNSAHGAALVAAVILPPSSILKLSSFLIERGVGSEQGRPSWRRSNVKFLEAMETGKSVDKRIKAVNAVVEREREKARERERERERKLNKPTIPLSPLLGAQLLDL